MENYLDSVRKQFAYYKMLGEKTFEQLPDDTLFWQYNPESNSIAVIVKHLWGNMLSRWTDFMTEDGEKSWRDRDGEFESDITTKQELMEKWQAGWNCLFDALTPLSDADLAELLNWILWRFDKADLGDQFRPYTAAEVGVLRRKPLRTEASQVRGKLVAGFPR